MEISAHARENHMTFFCVLLCFEFSLNYCGCYNCRRFFFVSGSDTKSIDWMNICIEKNEYFQTNIRFVQMCQSNAENNKFEAARLSWIRWLSSTNEWNNKILFRQEAATKQKKISNDNRFHSKIVFLNICCASIDVQFIQWDLVHVWSTNQFRIQFEHVSLKKKDQTGESGRERHHIIKSNCTLLFRMVAP